MYADLPFDVFEEILTLLDGRSNLAMACVCRSWASMCSLFNQRNRRYWRRQCFLAIPKYKMQSFSSGEVDEYAFEVFKCQYLAITRHDVKVIDFPLNERLLNLRTCHLVFGKFFIVTQGQSMSVFDATVGQLLYCVEPSHFNILNAVVIKRRLERDASLICDVLVLCCGGQQCSHLYIYRYEDIPGNLPLVHVLRRPCSPDKIVYCYSTHLLCNGQNDSCLSVRAESSNISVSACQEAAIDFESTTLHQMLSWKWSSALEMQLGLKALQSHDFQFLRQFKLLSVCGDICAIQPLNSSDGPLMLCRLDVRNTVEPLTSLGIIDCGGTVLSVSVALSASPCCLLISVLTCDKHDSNRTKRIKLYRCGQ